MSDPAGAVDQAMRALASGRLVVLVDAVADTAHLVGLARDVPTEAIATMATYGRGVLQVATEPERLAELGLPALGEDDGIGRPAYHHPVDLAGHDGPEVQTGRAATVRALADPATRPDALVVPGHVFPVAVAAGGVLCRPHAPEAAADLAGIAGGGRAAVFTRAVDEQGGPADRGAAGRLARRLGIVTLTIGDIVRYRERTEPAVRRVVDAALPTPAGALHTIGYEALRSPAEYVAFVQGDPRGADVRVHVHDQCLAGDALGGRRCACAALLEGALNDLRTEERGVIVYISRSDADGLRHLAGAGAAPARSPSHAAELAHVLRDLGPSSVRISANEPLDVERLGELADAELQPWAPERELPRHGAGSQAG